MDHRLGLCSKRNESKLRKLLSYPAQNKRLPFDLATLFLLGIVYSRKLRHELLPALGSICSLSGVPSRNFQETYAHLTTSFSSGSALFSLAIGVGISRSPPHSGYSSKWLSDEDSDPERAQRIEGSLFGHGSSGTPSSPTYKVPYAPTPLFSHSSQLPGCTYFLPNSERPSYSSPPEESPCDLRQ